jgi:ribonuclease P protein component
MLSRPLRLTSREFDAAFGASRSFRDGLLTLRIHWRSASEARLRAAFVVPKKLGKANWRNRARRRMRHAFQLQQGALQVLVGGLGECDCIFLASDKAHDADFNALQDSISNLLRRAVDERKRHRR